MSGSIGRFMVERVGAQSGAAEMLRAYVEGNVEFICSHRAPMKALLEIFLIGGLHYDATTDRTILSPLEAILRQGQEEGSFRAFDSRVMASVVQRAVEGLTFLLESVPDLDCDHYARELTILFELATARSPS